MTEQAAEQAFGRESVEVSQGYTPLRDPAPAVETEYKGDKGLREAARDMGGGQREAEKPVVRKIVDPRTGERPEGKFSISAEQALRHMTAQHRAEAEEQKAAEEIGLSLAYAEERAGAFPEHAPYREESQTDPAQQPPQLEQPDGAPAPPEAADAPQPEAEKAVPDLPPEIRQAIEREVTETQRARAEYANGLANAARLAQAAAYSTVPELAHLPPEQLPGALAMLQAKDPQRHAQVIQQLRATEVLQQRIGEIDQQNRAMYKQRFDSWAETQDRAFDARHPEFSDPKKGPVLREGIRQHLINDIGIPERALVGLWNNEIGRDAMMQELAFNSFKLKQAQENARNAVRAPLPPVLKPGAGPRPSRSELLQADIDRASSRLSSLKGEAATSEAVRLMQMNRQARGKN